MTIKRRKDIRSLKEKQKKDIRQVNEHMVKISKNEILLDKCSGSSKEDPVENSNGLFNPVGYIKSVFRSKNGIPRQPGLCYQSRATLSIGKDVFNNPQHSLEGLEQFSHIWVIFVFHKNNNSYTKAKVKPPRLNGNKVGLFSTRCPYRPNPIGLSLVKLDRVEDQTLYLSGVDLLDGTPVLDIKPYIPEYDQPHIGIIPEEQDLWYDQQGNNADGDSNDGDDRHDLNDESSQAQCGDCVKIEPVENKDDIQGSTSHKLCTINDIWRETNNVNKELDLGSKSEAQLLKSNNSVTSDVARKALDNEVSIAKWVASPPVHKLNVCFTEKAIKQLKLFSPQDITGGLNSSYKLKYMKSFEETQEAIVNILENDPRSVYRRTKCEDKLYYFTVDTVHVTCWFDDKENVVEIVKLQPV